ncbi:MAG: capsule biosynthesis protein [Sphingomonadales bacterium]|nr:capsule biosynthesis protein [Sphingomonadales bacterium]
MLQNAKGISDLMTSTVLINVNGVRKWRLSGRLRRLAATASGIVLLAGSVPVAAQVIGSNNVPNGSPLDPSGSGQNQQQGGSGQGQNQNSNPNPNSNSNGSTNNQSTIYEPVSVNRSSSSMEDGNTRTSTSMNGPRTNENGLLDLDSLKLRQPTKPGEFEIWAKQVTGRDLTRFGADLLLPGSRDFAMPATSTIPPDYALNIGDTISIALTGSVEGSVDVQIDRDGNIFLPNVGTVSILGVRYRDLRDRLSKAVGRKYRGYEVSVSIKRLRGVRVYVTGFATHPGAYSVNSLSTLVNALLQAGGPSAGGSFRSVKLYRNGSEVSNFDLYDLLRRGDRSRDPLLQNEDVLFIPPVGSQVAVIGSVNQEAIYETKPGESVADMLQLAGGPTNVADKSRVILYRLTDQDTVGSRQIDQLAAASVSAEGGDIVQILPQGTLARPLERQQAIVRIEGEVNKPGNYYVPPNTPLEQIVAMAGGLTPRAYVYGTRLSRESVRAQQRRSFLEAVDQMELTLAAAPLAGDQSIEAGERQTQLTAGRAFLDQLRRKEPDGRLVIELSQADQTLPGNLLLENNDRIIIPPRVDTVGVFGAVYRSASFLLGAGKQSRVKDYLEKAGGPIRGGDRGNIFVVRANGSVLTKRRGALNARALPGDAIFVPVRTQSSSILAKIRDITQIVYQLGLGAAAIAVLN